MTLPTNRCGPVHLFGLVVLIAAMAWPLRASAENRSLSNCYPRACSSMREAGAFERANLLTAEGRDGASAAILESLPRLQDGDLARRIRQLLMLNERSLFHYAEALKAISPQRGRRDAALDNEARLLEALAGIPPEEIVSGGEFRMREFALPAKIGGRRLVALVDTGAGFSAMSRTAARAAGVSVRAVGYRVRAARGGEVPGDVAVADVAVGGMRVRNVVFLVLPDSAFGNSSLSALIGLPVLRQLVLAVGAVRSGAAIANVPVAFANGMPVVRIVVDGASTVCELDSGSNRSWFAASRLPARAFIGSDRFARMASVTEIDGKTHILRGSGFRARIALGAKYATLPRALAISNPSPAERAAGCALGRDALYRLAPFKLDFRSMRIVFQQG